MFARRRYRREVYGVVLGTLVTVLVVALYAGGALGPIVRLDLDLAFRHWNRIEPDERIVLIDINDFALQNIAAWPWPRRLQADLIRVLDECGAEAILLDIVHSEPTAATLDDPRLAPDRDIELGGEVLGELTLEAAIDHDQELARAMAAAGNAYTAMYFPLMPPGRGLHAMRAAIRRLLDANAGIPKDELAASVGLKDPARIERIDLHARIDHLLRQDFNLDAAELARRIRRPRQEVARELHDVKEAAARWLVGGVMVDRPDATFAEVYAAICPDAPPDVETKDRQELKRAYYYWLSRRVALRPVIDGDLSRIIATGGDEVLPIPSVAAAARGVGFVSFEKDVDGILRHVAPLAEIDGYVVPQLGFAVVCDVLRVERGEVVATDPPRLALYDVEGRKQRALPLTYRGELLLNWHHDPDRPGWENSFRHVPVAQVLEVAIDRRAIAENIARIRLHFADAVELMFGGATDGYRAYAEHVRRWQALADHDDEGARRERAERWAQIAAVDEQALGNLDRLRGEIDGLEPENAEEERLFARVRRLHALLRGDYVREVERRNKLLADGIAARLTELRRTLEGKICLVGYTASAVADMVNTPVFNSMPGVMAHANMINTMLSGRFPRVAPVPRQAALILVAGLFTAFIAATRGPWLALAGMLFVAAGVMVASAATMRLAALHFGMIVPAAAAFVAWAAVTLFRQLTEQRQRRTLARALARNTSPAIAARITEQLDDFDLPPQPAVVTCYFSDLEGFTTLSEELGVEKTQTLLNAYLAAMAEILIGFRGFNKFMGDGIFAFMNAPLWPSPEHAAAGCEAALATQARLAALQATAEGPEAAALRGLRMRIGLHTGSVFVGYFGSVHQSDYTCIGDTVNLAARLESANKVFGTRILVSHACREAVGERYAFRPLGALQVKGKSAAVPVYELLGRSAEVDGAVRAYAEAFAGAVEEFGRRRWEEARAGFQRCAAVRPDDKPVELYLTEIERRLADPALADSIPALRLTTK